VTRDLRDGTPLRSRPLLPEHERVMVCTGCRANILVGGWVAELDPETFVGRACGCAKPVLDRPVHGSAASEAWGRARNAQQEAGVKRV
jgi:hypothetical protein